MADQKLARPYQPSNGCEGMDFMEEFCFRCAREAEPCPIQSATWLYETDDPLYPKEWVEDEKGARCTAFEAAK
jgi:hypothetical protein